MSGIVELEILLKSLSPKLFETEYIYYSHKEGSNWEHLEPLATFREQEGLSLIISRETAEREGFHFYKTFRLISLKVHSSLEAVGLTAAVADKLASKGISANVIAAYYHDHLLVPTHQALDAMAALEELNT